MTLHRHRPRSLEQALRQAQAAWSPGTQLARIQSLWPHLVGLEIAAVAAPVAENAGVLTVRCEASAWASELQMMAPRIIAAINSELGESTLHKLRCITASK